MPWTWRYEKADGTVVPADDLQEAIFISQGDAESWLGENWRALLAVGVDQVTLFDDSQIEYGPMSLHPEDLRQIHSLLQPRGRYAPSKVRYSSGPGRYNMQLNLSRRTRRPRIIVILCAVIVAVVAAVVITLQVSQRQTATPAVSCGSAWTHAVNDQTHLLSADHGALTCFARPPGPASPPAST